jgi:stearoyl-CoA desaturase (Delta-9 desaturase)
VDREEATYLNAKAQLSHENGKVYKLNIVWPNVAWYIVLHSLATYGFYVAVTQAMWTTVVWAILLYIAGGIGITGGAHRLWAHRSYKAKFPLRVILMIFNCIALQNDVIEWSRDHRVHHKYSETDADPHNSTRGLFFSHMGWLLVRKHPSVAEKGKGIDLSDLKKDPILRFQRKFYLPLAIFFCFIMPAIVPVYCWGESGWKAFIVTGVLRYTWTLHCTWTINSIAHMFGNRPYDSGIGPRQNLTAAFWALGEGWHNYHHVFPYDYRASENPYLINLTTIFIDFFGLIGWAYDRKTVSKESIERKKLRSGENSHSHNNAPEADDPDHVDY